MALFWSKLDPVIRVIETLSEVTGRFFAWAVLLLTLIVCYDVLMRRLFALGSVGLQELEWHLFALIFLFGAAYTLKHDGHVRLEIFYQRLGERGRAWVNLFGGIFFLLPLCVVVIKASWPFVYNAYIFGEGSADPGGLPYRYLIKAAIPLGFLLLLLQGLANILTSVRTLLTLSKS